MSRRPLALAALAALSASLLVWTPGLAGAAEPVRLLAGTTPATTPFPSDAFTVSDAAQLTGRRVALPTEGCGAQGRSLCDSLALINQLDGFDLQPRITLPFSGPVDLLSVSPQSVYVESPTGVRTGLVQLVFDPASNTVAGLTDTFLAQRTTYVLVVSDGLRGVDGTPVDLGGADRRIPFTTMTSTNTLDRARAALDDGTAYDRAGIAAGDRGLAFDAVTGMARSVFTGPQVTTITRKDQTFADPAQPRSSQAALNTAKSAAFIGFGSIRSPQYANGNGVIPSVPTGSAPQPLGAAQIGVTMMAGAKGSGSGGCLQPVVFGPGFTRSKYDLFLSGDELPGRGAAVFATDPLGHAYGPTSTFVVNEGAPGAATGNGFGRGKDLDGDGRIGASEGVGPTFTVQRDASGQVVRDPSNSNVESNTTPDQASPDASAGLRDGLIQTVIDNMALVRALEKGVDVDGVPGVDTCTGPGAVAYYGQSFGGIYGTMLLGSDPNVTTGVANVPGGPVVEIARTSGFRGNLAKVLEANEPDLRNGGPGRNGFTESMPLRLDPRVTDPLAGAIAIQETGARGNWVSRPGSPETYSSRLGEGGSFGTKRFLVQVAYTDGTVPNQTSGTLLRAGDLYRKAWIYRNDRTPTSAANPHGFLLDPTVAGRNQAQQQVVEFVTSRGGTSLDPDGPGNVWEAVATSATDYRLQLDCLHYPDPQTGAPRTVSGAVPDCVDRSGTVTAAQFAVAQPSGSPAPSTSTSASPSTTASPGTAAGRPYVALAAPVRVLDSRSGTGTAQGLKSGPVQVDLSTALPAGAQAAVLNVTVLNATRRGFVVVYPAGQQQPRTSNVNVEASVPGVSANTQANEVVVRLGPDRRATAFVDSTTADLVVDVVGYLGADRAAGQRLAALPPRRVLDTRETSTPLRRGETVLDLTGTPAEGASSVVLNVTATRPSARGFVVAYPTGTSRPGTSNVNVERGQTQANEVVTRVGAGNKVSLFVDSTEAALVVDLVGVVRATVQEGFVPLDAPQRVADSRTGLGLPTGRVAGTVRLQLPGTVPASARAVVLNVTATNGSRAGFVTVHPGGSAVPSTSNVNFPAGLTQANEVLVGVGSGRDVSLTVGGSGAPAAHLVVDVVGYLTG